jgi:penicillin-binding protein 1A
VVKEDTAWLLTDAMEDVLTSGTGTAAYFGTDMAQAGKSGTTTSNRDALFAGYTPYYTCVVWGGYDDNSKQTGGTTYPKKLWQAVMKRIHEDLPAKDFTKPSSITEETVCAKSGLLPKSGVCSFDPRGSLNYTEYFAEGTTPEETCDHHVLVTVCKTSGQLAGAYCPSDQVVTRACIVGVESGSGDSSYRAPGSTCTVHDENYSEEEPDEQDDTDDGDKSKKNGKKKPNKSDEEDGSDDEPEPLSDPGGSPALAVTGLWMIYFLRRRRRS